MFVASPFFKIFHIIILTTFLVTLIPESVLAIFIK